MTPMRGVKGFSMTLIMRPNNVNDGAQGFQMTPIMRHTDTNEGGKMFHHDAYNIISVSRADS